MSTLSSLVAAYTSAIEIDADRGRLGDAAPVQRRLSDLRGCFSDDAGFDEAVLRDDPLVYTVSALEPADGAGDLSIGLGVLMPGRIGREYFLTKGHYHAWREAGEFYIGLRGEGGLLLEDASGESRFVAFSAGEVVYVPGSTAHRTVNTGSDPLVYLGVYSARAGHDYAAIAAGNFRQAVVAGSTGPMVVDRSGLMRHGRVEHG